MAQIGVILNMKSFLFLENYLNSRILSSQAREENVSSKTM